jgi:hypothetical protein
VERRQIGRVALQRHMLHVKQVQMHLSVRMAGERCRVDTAVVNSSVGLAGYVRWLTRLVRRLL